MPVTVLDRRLLRESRVARRQIALTVGFGILSAGLILAQAGLLTDVVVAVSGGRALASVRTSLTALLVVVLLRATAAAAAETTARHAAGAVKSGLRARLLGHALRLGPSWLAGRRPGELTALATTGLDTLDPYFARFLPAIALAGIVPPIVLVRIGWADWVSAALLAASLPLIPVFLALVGYSTRHRTRRQWRQLAQLGGHFLDVVEGLPTLKAFRRGEAQEGIIRRVSDQLRRTTMSTLRVAFTSALVLELLATLGTALVAVAVGLRLLQGSLDYHTALLVLLLAPEVYLPLRALGGQFHASAEGAAAARDVFDVLDVPVPVEVPPQRTRSTHARRAPVRFHDISLTYPGRDRPVLDRVEFVLEPGSRTVLMGQTGAGKSSVLALLLRFVSPTDGHICVGGTRLDELPVAAWRQQLAWVSQAPSMFAGTVADNVRLSSPNASESAVREAVEMAGASQFVAALPDGLATPLGDRGLRLSTGQRQRIALARAFLRNPALLLLDEPTAHLDPITAATIRAAVERLMADRTVLLVTHHAAWTANADAVLTLESGRLTPALPRLTP
jgi:ATP-binding cassette subfamily C protein CydD